MQCINCAKEVEVGAKSCSHCGYQYGPIEIKMPEYGLEKVKRPRKSIVPVIKGMVFIGVIVAIIFVYMDKKNVNKSPLTVAKSSYAAIDKCDGAKFLKCISPKAIEALEQKNGKDYSDKMTKLLGTIDLFIEEEYGKNWVETIEYKVLSDTEIQVILGDTDGIMKIENIDGKYYITNPDLF